MPFARVSLRKGKSIAYLRALSDSLHKALVEAYDVPPEDCFQVFHQLDADELVFNRGYLSRVPRTDDFVLITITAGRPRSTETKRGFYRRLSECLAHEPGVASSDVMVIINTTQSEEWSFADGIAATDLPTK
jgi:phenylpyruvate tautomerase PptA (4-oxalocrotonate tautomerase family)